MIIQANAMHIPLADNSVQCVVTSPPYWGLRDYGTAVWEGGDEGCDHIETYNLKRGNNHGFNSGIDVPRGVQSISASSAIAYRDQCAKCGATRIDSQIGLESTPDEYVAKIVAVFREVKRVLRDDGTVWCNLGDSYAGGFGSGGRTEFAALKRTEGMFFDGSGLSTGLKPKNLVGVPWRVAFALQADGWYLRSDIIWSKPNPMPESVTDRPTKAHEYIFLLTKSERYYYDQDAVREPGQEWGERVPKVSRDSTGLDNGQNWNSWRTYSGTNPAGRNIRTVWNIATQPYPDAHFATFPEEIAKRCIMAGSKAGSVVLDPFVGSGTVVQVAQDLGRVGIGIDIKPDYLKMAKLRAAQMGLRLEGGAVA